MSSIRDFFPLEYKTGGMKPKKNFLIENRKYVTKLAKSNQASKENVNPSNKLCCPNNQKFKLKHEPNKDSVPENSKKHNLDKIDASIKSIRSVIAQTKITQEKLGIKNCGKTSSNIRNQATQTINPYNEEDILKDSIIRYPKSRNSDTAKAIQINNMNTNDMQTMSSEPECFESVSRKSLKCIQKDYNSKKKQPNIVVFKENIISHHQPGEIPKYLQDRKALKEKYEKETQKKLAIRRELGLDDPACPPGHIRLPDSERLDHLAKIQKDYNRLVMQLNMLPVSSDSFKMKEKRKHLEKELDKLQLGIKLFSKEKLYVKFNPKNLNSYKQ